MDTQPLKLQIDSKAAQADLAALAKALDKAGSSVEKMQGKFASGMSGTDEALRKSMATMGKFAEVANLVGKIKIAGDPSKQIRDFAQAMGALSRAKAIDPTQIGNIKTLTKTLGELKVPTGAARLTEFLNAVGGARAPSEAQVGRLKDVLKLLANYKPTAATKNTAALSAFFNSISNIKVPSDASIARLEKMFKVLGEAKELPNAAKIAADLDKVAQAAGRAGTAFKDVPQRMGAFAPAAARAEKAAAQLGNQLNQSPKHAAAARGAFGSIGSALGTLGDRFKLTYQLGTLFSAFFSSFTIGQFLHGIYETGIEMQKLQKALLFSTGSFKESGKAMQDYINMAQDLGLNIDKSAESYLKFTISAKASGMNIEQSNKVFGSVAQTLQIVGASSEQAGLALYGLTEMMQKGEVLSKEFNRQIGAQIPGNAVIGARAMSELQGKYVSVAQFFKEMSKGQVLSPDFVPAWAKALREEYGDLKPLLEMRPDVQLNKLVNAFIMFKKAIGDAGFMRAIGQGFASLTSKLTYTDATGTHLTKTAQDLATSLGHNLAKMIEGTANALGLLIQHLPELIIGLKALLALKVGATFASWGGSLKGFGDKMTSTGLAARAFSAQVGPAAANDNLGGAASSLGAIGALEGDATRAIIARRGAGAFRTVTARQGLFSRFSNAFQGVVGGWGASAIGPQRVPYMASAAALRQAHPLMTEEGAASLAAESRTNWTNAMRSKARVGANMFAGAGAAEEIATAEKAVAKSAITFKGLGEAAGNMAKGGLSAAMKGIMGFGAFLPGVGTIAMIAGIALAAFGDSITELKSKAGNAVKVNDITGASFDSMSKKVGAWAAGLLGFSGNADKLNFSWGKVVALLMASVETVIGGLMTLASTLGKVLGTALASVVIIVYDVAQAINKALHGDFKGAQGAFGSIGSDMKKAWGDTFASIKDDFKVFDVNRNYQQIIAGAGAKADARTAADQKASENDAVQAQMEQQLQARQALNEAASNAGELEMLQNRANLSKSQQPTFDDVLKRFAEAGDKTASAATIAAGAADTTAKAATVAASGVAAGKIDTTGAKPETLEAIKRASSITGVDYSLMLAIAKQESTFDPHAIAHDAQGRPVGSARGLFQFNYKTALSSGLTNAGSEAEYIKDPGKAFDAQYASLAAARLIKAIDDELAAKLPDDHKITNTDTYAGFMLGSPMAASLIKAVSSNPNMKFTDLGDQAKTDAASNKWMQGKTVQQVYDFYSQKMSGAGGNTAVGPSTMKGLDALEGQGLTDKFANLNKQFDAIFAEVDPAQAAASKLQETIDRLSKLASANDTLKGAGLPGQESVIPGFQGMLKRLQTRLEQEQSDAKNPFSKDTRVAGEEQAVMALRLKGMSDEADFQDKLNKLKEAGYDITVLDTKANRDAAKAISDVADAQKSQLDVITAMNSARQAQIARTGSARQVNFAQQVSQFAKPGQTYDQTLASLDPSVIANLNKVADINEQSRRTGAVQNINDQLGEMAATARMNAQQKQFYDDYKGYLKDLTGVQSDSLSTISAAASDADKKLADSWAKTKQALENPPGFQKWADALEPMSKKLEDIKASFAEGLSNSITDSIVDPKNAKQSWSNLFANTQRQLVKASVDNMLGGAIEMITGKKKQPTSPQEIAQANAQAAQTQAQSSQTFAQSTQTFSQAVQAFTSGLQSAASTMGSGTGSYGGGSGLPDASSLTTSNILGGPSIAANQPLITPGSLNTTPDLSGLSGLTSMLSDGAGGLPDASSLTTSNILGPQYDIAANTPLLSGPLSTSMDLSGLAGMTSTGAGGGLGGLLGSMGSGLSGMMGGGLGMIAGLGAGIASLLGHHKSNTNTTYPVNGVIGESRPVNVSYTLDPAHANPIAGLLDMGLSMFTGGMGGGGGMLGSLLGQGSMIGNSMSSLGGMMGLGSGQTLGMAGTGAGNLGSLIGLFKEGGYTNSPVGMTSAKGMDWGNAPHYSEGTPNTSGGIQAVLHPDEAVIPLSRGRKIPVDLGNQPQASPTMNTNITVVANDPNQFRQSQGSINRSVDRQLRRTSQRNLLGK